MEYVILALLIVAVLLLFVLVLKNNNGATDTTEKLGRFETNIIKEIGDFKVDFSNHLRGDFDKLNQNVENKLLEINDRVNRRLDENFEKTNKTFSNVLERLSKIDEAQKKIDGLSTEIISLQSVLTDKKTRGIFGEVNLNYILSSVFGDNNTRIYQTQYKLSNGTLADAVLFAPNPLGTICIDSKFPLENYERMTNRDESKEIRELALKHFKMDLKKHIDAIHDKYIIEGETASEAILFLPAEAIFAEINAYHSDILRYAYQKKVWITSPTTLMSTLTTIYMIIKNMERDKYAKVIHEELNKLGVEFERYRVRWSALSNHIETVHKDVRELTITTDKISKRFDSISNAEIETKDSDESKYITN